MADDSGELMELLHCRVTAISTKSNPRHLEYPWYAFWNVAAKRMVRLSGTGATVIPQFGLWYASKAEIDDDDEFDEHRASSSQSSQADITGWGTGWDRASVVAETINTKSYKRVTDFAVVMWDIEGVYADRRVGAAKDLVGCHFRKPPPKVLTEINLHETISNAHRGQESSITQAARAIPQPD